MLLIESNLNIEKKRDDKGTCCSRFLLVLVVSFDDTRTTFERFSLGRDQIDISRTCQHGRRHAEDHGRTPSIHFAFVVFCALSRLQSYAKKLVNADRASLFMVDSRTKELYARIFDIGREEDDVLDSSTKNDADGQKHLARDERACIRFPLDKGIAGYVATTGKTLNIVDAYSDNRFNRYETRDTCVR
jgi:hypothetical protein